MELDEPIRPDVQSVLNAAALLDVTEYELFHAAYRHWFGHGAGERDMEPVFVAYMFDEVVPQWVRHFTRQVERASRAGSLDRAALGIRTPARSRRRVSRGVRYAALVLTWLFVLVVLAQMASRLIGTGEGCFFPPCY